MIYGEWAALLTAIFWTVTALSFESAGKRIGSLVVNWVRLLMAIVFLGFFGLATRGLFLPTDASLHAWMWLGLSGLVGFTVGDLALFRAFVLIGARRSMLLMSLVPLLSTLFGWLWMGETLGKYDWLGMALTMGGVAWVISERKKTVVPQAPEGSNGQMSAPSPTTSEFPLAGVLLGLLAALGQAVGLVLSKIGLAGYNAFAGAQIRVIVGFLGFTIIFFIVRWWKTVWQGMKNGPAMRRVTLGAFFGPFLGVSFSLAAVQTTQAGVAATIMSLVPVLILVPSMILFKEKVTWRGAAGAFVAVGGVVLLFLES